MVGYLLAPAYLKIFQEPIVAPVVAGLAKGGAKGMTSWMMSRTDGLWEGRIVRAASTYNFAIEALRKFHRLN